MAAAQFDRVGPDKFYLTYDVPHTEKKIITEITEERVIGIVTISCLDDANSYSKEIDIPRENIVFVNRKTKHAKTSISFDFKLAGADTPDGPFIVYQQNYESFGREIAALVNERVHGRPTANQASHGNDGLSRWTIMGNNEPRKSLSLMMIDSPTTDALKKIAHHFTKCTGIALEITVDSYEGLYQLFANEKQGHNHCGYDIIRMDMAWLPWFGKDVFRPLQLLDQELDDWIVSLSPHIRANYSQIEDVAYALPFDPSIQMLFYRKDLFEDPKIKRLYYEKNKKQLSVPEDFDSYNEIVRFFSSDAGDLLPTEYGTSVTLGIAEIIAAEFLSGYYAGRGTLVAEPGVELDRLVAVNALTNYLQTVSLAQRLDAALVGGGCK